MSQGPLWPAGTELHGARRVHVHAGEQAQAGILELTPYLYEEARQ